MLNLICAKYKVGGKTYESWVTCGPKVGPNGVSAKVGDSYYSPNPPYFKAVCGKGGFWHPFNYVE